MKKRRQQFIKRKGCSNGTNTDHWSTKMLFPSFFSEEVPQLKTKYNLQDKQVLMICITQGKGQSQFKVTQVWTEQYLLE